MTLSNNQNIQLMDSILKAGIKNPKSIEEVYNKIIELFEQYYKSSDKRLRSSQE